MARSQYTPMERAFVKHYLTDAKEDHVRAAELAGYKQASTTGLKILRRLQPLLQEEQAKYLDSLVMSPADIIRGFGEIARDAEHRDRFNALKALAQMHNLLDGNLKVPDRKALLGDLVETLTELKGSLKGGKLISEPSPSSRKLPAA